MPFKTCVGGPSYNFKTFTISSVLIHIVFFYCFFNYSYVKGPSLQSNPQMPKEPRGQKVMQLVILIGNLVGQQSDRKWIPTYTLHSPDYQFSIPYVLQKECRGDQDKQRGQILGLWFQHKLKDKYCWGCLASEEGLNVGGKN